MIRHATPFLTFRNHSIFMCAFRPCLPNRSGKAPGRPGSRTTSVHDLEDVVVHLRPRQSRGIRIAAHCLPGASGPRPIWPFLGGKVDEFDPASSPLRSRSRRSSLNDLPCSPGPGDQIRDDLLIRGERLFQEPFACHEVRSRPEVEPGRCTSRPPKACSLEGIDREEHAVDHPLLERRVDVGD